MVRVLGIRKAGGRVPPVQGRPHLGVEVDLLAHRGAVAPMVAAGAAVARLACWQVACAVARGVARGVGPRGHHGAVGREQAWPCEAMGQNIRTKQKLELARQVDYSQVPKEEETLDKGADWADALGRKDARETQSRAELDFKVKGAYQTREH